MSPGSKEDMRRLQAAAGGPWQLLLLVLLLAAAVPSSLAVLNTTGKFRRLPAQKGSSTVGAENTAQKQNKNTKQDRKTDTNERHAVP